MNVSSLATLAAAVAALGVSIAACGTTNNNAVEHSSALGESCLTTADCSSGVCVANTCVAATSAGDGGAGTSSGGSDSGGTSSGMGTSSGGSSGGSSGAVVPEAAPPHLGARGDACSATSDCGPSLSCIYTGAGVGFCDLASYNLGAAATGKTCTGECNTAADCCDLPVDVVIGGVEYHHCNDIQNQVIGGAGCPIAPDTTPLGIGCFYFNTYCGSCGSAWACTANECVYNTPCTASGLGIGGCPDETRTGRPLLTTCSAQGVCGGAGAGGCTAASDCAGRPYTPFTGEAAGTCRAPGATGANDCVCQSGTCYLGCNKDLDCATGYTCDTTSHLCKVAGACQTDAQCAVSKGNVLSKCMSGTCTSPCQTDHDCSRYSGVVSSFNGNVCNNGVCQVLGCTMDSDCNITSAGNPDAVHLFCIAQASGAAAAEVSAITN